jgi:hypothetical protein
MGEAIRRTSDVFRHFLVSMHQRPHSMHKQSHMWWIGRTCPSPEADTIRTASDLAGKA